MYVFDARGSRWGAWGAVEPAPVIRVHNSLEVRPLAHWDETRPLRYTVLPAPPGKLLVTLIACELEACESCVPVEGRRYRDLMGCASPEIGLEVRVGGAVVLRELRERGV